MKKTLKTARKATPTKAESSSAAPRGAAVEAETSVARRAKRPPSKTGKAKADAPAREAEAPAAIAKPVAVEQHSEGVVFRFAPAAKPKVKAPMPASAPVAIAAPPVPTPAPVASAPLPSRAPAYEAPPAPVLDDDEEGDDPLERAAEMFEELEESETSEPIGLLEREPVGADDEYEADLDDVDEGPEARPALAGAADEPASPSKKRRRRRRRGRRGGGGGGGEREPVEGAAAHGAGRNGSSAVADDRDQDDSEEEEAPAAGGRGAAEVIDVDEDGREIFMEDAREAFADEEESDEERPTREPAGGSGARGRRGGRRRGRRMWQRDRDDVADFTDSEYVAGVVEPGAAVENLDADGKVVQDREMIINIVPNEECRIAVLKNGRLEEIYLERASAENHVGNIYKGVVTNVEASIQAAFVDFGLGKNGFLHISDIQPQYFPSSDRHAENVGRKMPRRHRPPIQRCLRRGQEILVQITKEGIGTKGPTLTTYLSIPGRFLVMMPGMRRLGVSRKIEDEDARQALREVMQQLELSDDMGFIARTAAMGRSVHELQTDLNYLTRLWRAVERRIESEEAPAELYRETDLVTRTIRDVFTPDIARIVVDDAQIAERAREFLAIFNPQLRDSIQSYDGGVPIFHRYGIEAELERLHSRHVPLKSGGSLVIDQTEALVAIDVNSGKFRQEHDAENTAYKINMEAADEIPRQLRLRDLGGVIICDFIDMRDPERRRAVENRLIVNLKQHKERAKVLRMSAFGMIEMTRQRQRASLMHSVYQDCRHCHGRGLQKTAESVCLDVVRLLQLSVTQEHIATIDVVVSPEVANLLLNRKRWLLHQMETRYRRTVTVRPDAGFSLDQVMITCFDARGRAVTSN